MLPFRQSDRIKIMLVGERICGASRH